jgi:hypothetical protein
VKKSGQNFYFEAVLDAPVWLLVLALIVVTAAVVITAVHL